MSELVPLSYDRNAWNALHDAELREHNDHLTAEQAEHINNHFDIHVVVGTHGFSLDALPNTPSARVGLPTQREYEAAASMTDGLNPGDTLFVERYGFDRPRPSSFVAPEPSKYTPEDYGLWRQMIEFGRSEYGINAWDYAHQIANFKGVQVVYADYDAFQAETAKTASGNKDISDLKMGDPLLARTDARREQNARNIIKDWALDHMPTEADTAEVGRKPKLVLLFGSNHKAGLEQAFQDLGLQATVTEMEQSSFKERLREQAFPIIVQLGSVALEGAVQGARGAADRIKSTSFRGAKHRADRE